MKTKMYLLFGLVFAFSITDTSAQLYNDSRTKQQGIWSGYKNGQVTKVKAGRLVHQQMNIRKGVRRAKCNDGQFSRSEKARMMHQKQMAVRNTYSYNQNKRSRF